MRTRQVAGVALTAWSWCSSVSSPPGPCSWSSSTQSKPASPAISALTEEPRLSQKPVRNSPARSRARKVPSIVMRRASWASEHVHRHAALHQLAPGHLAVRDVEGEPQRRVEVETERVVAEVAHRGLLLLLGGDEELSFLDEDADAHDLAVGQADVVIADESALLLRGDGYDGRSRRR